jgi:hypothetical protein
MSQSIMPERPVQSCGTAQWAAQQDLRWWPGNGPQLQVVVASDMCQDQACAVLRHGTMPCTTGLAVVAGEVVRDSK